MPYVTIGTSRLSEEMTTEPCTDSMDVRSNVLYARIVRLACAILYVTQQFQQGS
jgi:hypothetical protein